MKAISMRQPWPALMLHFGRRIDNRSKRTTYRGPIAIHAGATYNRHQELAALALAVLATRDYDGERLEQVRRFDFRAQPRGAIVATAVLADCKHVLDLPDDLAAWTYLGCGEYAYIFEEITPLPEPIPCSGKLGIFDVPDDLFTRR